MRVLAAAGDPSETFCYLAGCLASVWLLARWCWVWLCEWTDRPLTETDRYCAAVDEAADRAVADAERERREMGLDR